MNKLGLINLESALAQGTIARPALHKVSSLALNAWKENTSSTLLTSAAGCLEFGAGKKTSFCLGHVGLFTSEKRPNDAPLTSAAGHLKFGGRKKTFSCLGHTGPLPPGRRTSNAPLMSAAKYFEFVVHGSLNAWKENKQRRSEVP